MRSIVSVRSNIKSDHVWEVKLQPKTILAGQPYSGKSSVVEAITLALRGHGDDVVFGKPKTAQGLLALIGGSQSELVSELTFDDGSKALYAFKVKGKGSFSKPDHSLPGWAKGAAGFLPLHDIQARLVGDPAKAMDAFLGAAGITIQVEKARKSVEDKLSRRAKDAYSSIFNGEVPHGAEPTDGVLWLAWLRDVARRAKLDADAAARLSGAAASAVVAFSETTTQEAVDEAKRELAWHEAGVPGLLWRFRQVWEALPVEGGEVSEEVEPEAEGVLTEEEAELADKAAEAHLEIQHITAYLDAAKTLGEYYAYKLPYPIGAREEWTTYRSDLQAWLDAIEPRLKRPAAPEAPAEASGLSPQEAYDEAYLTLEAALGPFELTVEACELPETEPEAVDLSAMRMDVARLEMLLKQQAERGASKGVAKTFRGDAAEYKEVADAAEEALAEVVTANKAALEARISRFLPKTDRCVITTTAFGVEGLFMPHIVHTRPGAAEIGGPAFSGYESNMLLMALAGATIKEDAPFACLIPSDRDRGSDLLSMMTTWKDSPFQVIITTNSAYMPELRPWEKVEITRGSLQ